MTNTKEYNEAVEKISKTVGNIDKAFSMEDIIKFTIDALGVEIVSRENAKVYECKIDEVDFDNQIASFKVPENFEVFAGTYYISSHKPAVYLETIKENAGKL